MKRSSPSVDPLRAARRAAAAERQRRSRERRKAIEMVVAVTVGLDVTEALVAAGRLSANHDGDREEIARAIELLLAEPMRPVTRDDAPISDRISLLSTSTGDRREALRQEAR